MPLVSKSAQKQLEKFKGIDPKAQYTITDHLGKEQTLSGVDLKKYLVAHGHFINVEQQGISKPKST